MSISTSAISNLKFYYTAGVATHVLFGINILLFSFKGIELRPTNALDPDVVKTVYFTLSNLEIFSNISI